MNGRGSLIAGATLILVGVVLFWASTRRTLSPHARMFLEGQASIAVPAGLAALGVGAYRSQGAGRAGGQARKERRDPGERSRDPKGPKG